MRQSQPQRLAHHLRRCRGAQELASAARRSAGAATNFGRILQRDLILSKARADGLHLSRILARLRQQGYASGNKNGGLLSRRGQRHHHGRQPLVAGGNAHHALAGGQRAHQAAQHNGRIVAKRQRVQHARCALGAAIAGIGACSRKRNRAQCLQFARGFSHQQAHFPVSGMEAKGNGLAVFGAQAAMRAQNQEFGIEQAIRLPAHAGILAQAEEISRRLGQQHLRGERQQPRRALAHAWRR